MELESATDARIEQALGRALELGEVGVQLAAYLRGELIVEACAGLADASTGRPVEPSTLFPVFSVTKALTATALHVQAERGLIDYEAPVATYWPGFAAEGKAQITVRQALSHQASIPWMPKGVSPERQADWDWMIAEIERTAPAFEPGTNCYHAMIWGWIIGELVRRTDPGRRAFAQFVRNELLRPLAIEDLYLGLPPPEDPRVARLVGGEAPDPEPFEAFLRGMPRAVFPSASVYNTEISRRTVNPSAGVVATARAMARLFALLAGRGELDGVRLLSEQRLLKCLELRTHAHTTDRYMGAALPIGIGGYWLGGDDPAAGPVIGPNRSILQHGGAGGSIAWAELDTGLSVAICHNHMRSYPDPDLHPWIPVAHAVRAVAYERLGTGS